MRKITLPAALALALSLAGGCGDKPEIQIEQAKIALGSEKFDQALESANNVLTQQPDNVQAMQIKAEAQLRLARLDESLKSIEALLKADPESKEAHRLMVTWSFRKMGQCLKQSDFALNPKWTTQFEEALTIGSTHVKWIADHGQNVAEASVLKARLAEGDARRLQTLYEAEKAAALRQQREQEGTGQTTDDLLKPTEVMLQLQEQADAKLIEARDHLQAALAADPRAFEAADQLARLLVEKQDWAGLWILSQQLGQQPDVPVGTAARMCSSLLKMPDIAQAPEYRVENAWKLINAVKEDQRKNHEWKISAARLHLAGRNPDQAIPLLNEVLKAKPKDTEGRFLLAQGYAQQEKFAQSRDMLKQLSVEMPRAARVQSMYGMMLLKTGDLALAKEALRRATELDPDDSAARENFLSVMAQQGFLKEAGPDVEAFYVKNPADPRAIRMKLQYEMARGNRDAAVAVLQNTSRISPLADDHVSILIDGYGFLQQHTQMEEYARELVKRLPDDINPHLRLAEALLMQGKDDQVKPMLDELREKFPKSASVDQLLGKLYLQRQSFDKSVELLTRTVEAEPNNTEARLLLARALASLALTDEALEHIGHVLELDPANSKAHALAARVYQFMGQADKADQHLAQIDPTKLDPDTAPTLVAQLKVRAGDIDGARDVCNSAIASGNNDPVLRLLLAGIYMRQGEPAQAETHLLALARTQPNNPQVYTLLVNYYAAQKRVDAGLHQLTEFQTSNEPLALLAQATLLSRFDRVPEALKKLTPIYEPMIGRRDPRAMAVADALARLYATQNDGTAAHAVYQALIDQDFLTAEATLRQTDLLALRDGPEATLAKLDALAKQLTPEQDRLRYQVMRRYVQLARPERALALLDEWVARSPEKITLLRWKGELLMELGRGPDAVDVFKKAIETSPEDVMLRGRLAQAYLTSYDFPAAEATLREAMTVDQGAKMASLLGLGEMFVGLGLNRQAVATLDELEKSGQPKDPRLMYAMGRALASLDQNEQARERLAQVPSFSGLYANAQVLLARLEHGAGLADDARNRLTALAADPRTATTAVRELLVLNIRDKQDQEIIRWADQALSLERLPNDARAKWLMVRVNAASLTRDWSAALTSLDRLAELEPKSAGVVAARVLMLTRLDKRLEARALVTEFSGRGASTLDGVLRFLVGLPDDQPPRQGLAGVLVALGSGDLDAARSAAENMPPMRTVFRADLLALIARPDAKSPEMATAARMLAAATIASEIGQSELAVELTELVLKQYPGLPLAEAIQLATIEKSGEEATKAVDALGKSSDQLFSLYVQAVRLSLEGKHAQAADAFRALLDKEPDNEHIRYLLAQRLQVADKPQEAIQLLRQIADKPGAYQATAKNDLAYLLAEHQPDKLDEAYMLAQQAFAANSGNPALLDTIGWIEIKRNNAAKGLELLSRSAQALSKIPDSHYHLGVAYAAVGQNQWARYHLEEAAAGPADREITGLARKALEGLSK